jgi:hypothetical protein
MWSQTWNNILDVSTPYPEKEAVDVTPQMKKQVTHFNSLCMAISCAIMKF